MGTQPCIESQHVWVEQAGYKGQRYMVCTVCDTTGEKV